MKRIKSWFTRVFINDVANRKELYKVWLFIKYAMLPCVASYFFLDNVLFNGIWENKFILFAMFSGVCIGVAETLDDHFDFSIFKKLNPNFWDKNKAWKLKYFTWIPDAFTDAWHIFKTIALFSGAFGYVYVRHSELEPWQIICALCYFYNWAFTLFYDVILIKK